MLDHVIRTNEIFTTDYIIEEIQENLMSKVTDQNRDRVLEKLKDIKEMTTIIRSEQYFYQLPYALNRISYRSSFQEPFRGSCSEM